MKTNQPKSVGTSMFNVRCWMLNISVTLFLFSAASALATLRYVDLNSPSPTPPYTNWATAAHVIQDAVDAAAPGDTILVTNGVYATGGRPAAGFHTITNRAAVDKQLNLLSVNGPQVTIIRGYQVPGITNGYLAGGRAS